MTAAIYARKSTDQSGVGDDQKSVARQVDHARAFASRNGWAVSDAHVYVDDGISGAEFEKRPGFQRLLGALAPKPRFDVLVMSEESRLGRESIETGRAFKQIVRAGVRVFVYLDGRELTLDSPADKFMLSAKSFASETERDMARKRTYDAMRAKAAACHVTGGRVFGYRNVDITVGKDASGRPMRSHVERQVHKPEAKVVRQIFTRYAAGDGLATIAKALNRSDMPCPRAQRGRPSGWSPSTIRSILNRDVYRGVVVWNKSRKRDIDGKKRQRRRPESEWLRVEASSLRIVDDATWAAVRRRFEDVARQTRRSSDGRLASRPPTSGVKKYLLSGLACCVCGGGMEALSRKSGDGRSYVYGCAAHRRKGDTACANGLLVPMDFADETVVSAIDRAMFRCDVLNAAIDRAEAELASDENAAKRRRLESEIAATERELERLVEAIAAGDAPSAVLAGIKAREARLAAARAELAACAAVPMTEVSRWELAQEVLEWRELLRGSREQGRQVIAKLLDGDWLVFEPTADGYRIRGLANLNRLVILKVASPTGFEPVFWP